MTELEKRMIELNVITWSDSTTEDEKKQALLELGAISALSLLSNKQQEEMLKAIETVSKSVEIAENLLKIFKIFK